MERVAPGGGQIWSTSRLRARAGCDGLQIDGPGFSEVVVLDFRS